MVQIPVYVFTGFLDSGKTKFIQDTLSDSRFNNGERTLLLVFEEGEEEYDFSTYPHQNVFLPHDMTPHFLFTNPAYREAPGQAMHQPGRG